MNVDTAEFEALRDQVDSHAAKIARTDAVLDELLAICDRVGARLRSAEGFPHAGRNRHGMRLVKGGQQ